MTSPRAFGILATAFFCAVAVGCWALAQEKAPAASEFEGKFLYVLRKSDPQTSNSMEKAQIKKLGNAFFLVGVGAATGHPDEWQIGLAIWIALDDVSEITVFPTLDALKKAISLGRD